MAEKDFWWRKLGSQEKEELLRRIADDARYNEVHYRACSQATLGALLKNLKIGDNAVFKAACPLSGGAGMGGICGAASGGLLAIGSVYGREQFQEDLDASKDPAYAEVRRRANYFLLNFRNEYGYLTCWDIRYQVRGIPPFAQVYPLDPTPEDYLRVDQMYPNHYKCGDVCAIAAQLAAETIMESQIVLES